MHTYAYSTISGCPPHFVKNSCIDNVHIMSMTAWPIRSGHFANHKRKRTVSMFDWRVFCGFFLNTCSYYLDPEKILVPDLVENGKNRIAGWWFRTCFIFPFSWEFHHPNWRTHIFQRGRSTTNQNWLVVLGHTGFDPGTSQPPKTIMVTPITLW